MEGGLVEFEPVDSDSNPADVFTKPSQPAKFKCDIDYLMARGAAIVFSFCGGVSALSAFVSEVLWQNKNMNYYLINLSEQLFIRWYHEAEWLLAMSS